MEVHFLSVVFDAEGFMALDYASSHTEFAMALIAHGANPKLNVLHADWTDPVLDGEVPPGMGCNPVIP